MNETPTLKWKLIAWFSDVLMPPTQSIDLQLARKSMRDNSRTPVLSGSHPKFASVIDGRVAGVAVRHYVPADAKPGRVVYFHGGGWVTGDLDSHDSPVRGLAAATQREVVAVDYRLAPEHRFPAAFEDCVAVTKALAADQRVVVAGDSAGGNLAATVANRFAKEGLPLVAQVLVYPVTDAAMNRPSYERYAKGHLLSADTMRFFWDSYVPELARRNEPEASPLLAPSLKGVAPAYVLLAQCDVLRDEGREYAKKLQADGVETLLDEVPGTIHGFFSLQGLSEAKEARTRIAQWLAPRW